MEWYCKIKMKIEIIHLRGIRVNGYERGYTLSVFVYSTCRASVDLLAGWVSARLSIAS